MNIQSQIEKCDSIGIDFMERGQNEELERGPALALLGQQTLIGS
jgi:hypothetical protein